MPDRQGVSRAERDSTLALLRRRLEKVERSAQSALGALVGADAEEARFVYASYIAWLHDRICEVEAWPVLEDAG